VAAQEVRDYKDAEDWLPSLPPFFRKKPYMTGKTGGKTSLGHLCQLFHQTFYQSAFWEMPSL
jgi:hypothetical protein